MNVEEATRVDKFLSNIDKTLPKFYWVINADVESKKNQWSKEEMKSALRQIDEIYDHEHLQVKVV